MSENSSPRRLTTIVALDVAGYSARTENDEASSIAEVMALRTAIEAIAQIHAGRLFNTAGDGFMLEFGSSLAAVEAAAELAEKCQPKVRIGVHLGDVAVQPNGDLLGHGVNVAARLMAQSLAGSALISGAVRQTLRGPILERLTPRGSLKLDKMSETIVAYALLTDVLPLKPLGPRSSFLSGPTRRSLLFGGPALLATAVAGGSWVWLGRRTAIDTLTAPMNSIAVLPFANLSGDPKQDYFSDGLSEELRAALAQIRALQVAGRTSSNIFKNTSEDVPEIARKLGVNFLLDGSVRRDGDSIRVTAQLVEGATGFARWSQTYERPVRDVFAVQSDIAALVVGELKVKMFGAAPGVALGGTKNIQAYEAFLRGEKLYDLSGSEPTYRGAAREFTAALTVDPGYAKAYAWRAKALIAIGNQFASSLEAPSLVNSALSDATKAVELAPDLPSALQTLAFLRFNEFLDARGPTGLFERSMILGSGDAAVLGNYGLFSARIGRFDVAIPALKRAAALNPLDVLAHKQLGGGLYAARDFIDSIVSFRRALELSPNMNSAHAAIGDCHLMLGNLLAARVEYVLEPQALTHFTGLAIIERKLGNRQASETALAQLVASRGDNALYQQAQVLAQWTEDNEALATLEHAYKVRDSGMVYLKNDPFLDRLRSSPRFVQLLKLIGFA